MKINIIFFLIREFILGKKKEKMEEMNNVYRRTLELVELVEEDEKMNRLLLSLLIKDDSRVDTETGNSEILKEIMEKGREILELKLKFIDEVNKKKEKYKFEKEVLESKERYNTFKKGLNELINYLENDGLVESRFNFSISEEFKNFENYEENKFISHDTISLLLDPFMKKFYCCPLDFEDTEIVLSEFLNLNYSPEEENFEFEFFQKKAKFLGEKILREMLVSTYNRSIFPLDVDVFFPFKYFENFDEFDAYDDISKIELIVIDLKQRKIGVICFENVEKNFAEKYRRMFEFFLNSIACALNPSLDEIISLSEKNIEIINLENKILKNQIIEKRVKNDYLGYTFLCYLIYFENPEKNFELFEKKFFPLKNKFLQTEEIFKRFHYTIKSCIMAEILNYEKLSHDLETIINSYEKYNFFHIKEKNIQKKFSKILKERVKFSVLKIEILIVAEVGNLSLFIFFQPKQNNAYIFYDKNSERNYSFAEDIKKFVKILDFFDETNFNFLTQTSKNFLLNDFADIYGYLILFYSKNSE